MALSNAHKSSRLQQEGAKLAPGRAAGSVLAPSAAWSNRELQSCTRGGLRSWLSWLGQRQTCSGVSLLPSLRGTAGTVSPGHQRGEKTHGGSQVLVLHIPAGLFGANQLLSQPCDCSLKPPFPLSLFNQSFRFFNRQERAECSLPAGAASGKPGPCHKPPLSGAGCRQTCGLSTRKRAGRGAGVRLRVRRPHKMWV